MTSFNAALSGSDYTLLRGGSYAGDYLITLCANRIVLAGQVDSALESTQAWAAFAYNNVTQGSYTDVEVGQVLIISSTNDITKAEFRGRIRSAPDASIIRCNESSQDFSIGAYFWVIDTFDVNYKLSRPDSAGTEFVDYNVAYTGPEPMVVGLRTAYVDYVDSGTGKMRVAFDVSSSYATVPSGSISSYQFTFAAGTYTVISGSLSSSAVTVDFDPGEQWGKLVITDSAGIAKTRHFYINAHDASNPPNLDFEGAQITGDLSRGWALTVPAFDGVDDLLRDTFCVVWRANEIYGGTAGELYPTNNIAFTGWFQREDDEARADQTASIVEDARFEFTGIGPRMARLTAQLLAITLSGSPSAWGELASATPWRAICHFLSRYTTVANLSDVDFSDKSDTFLFPAFSTQGGNVFNAVGGIAGQINALLETAPDGRIQINRNAEYLDSTQRSTLVTVGSFTTEDVVPPTTRTLEENRSIGKVDADGATYNSVTGQVTVFTARAPGIAQGEAAGSSTLGAQILTYNSNPFNVLDELRQRVGNAYEVGNNSETLSVEFPDGYAPIFIPSKGQLFAFTLAALTGSGVNRIVYTTATKWTLESVTIGRPGNGATSVRCNFRKLNRVGDLGDNTTLPPQNSLPDPAPDLGEPAFSYEDPDVMFPEAGLEPAEANPVQLLPPPGQALATNGQTVIASNGTNAWLLKNFIALKKPQAVDVTPSDLGSYTIKAVLFDPFSTSTSVGAYILASDGTNSAVWYTANVAAALPTWTKGADVSGVYTVMRACSAANTIAIYSPAATGGGTWSETFDFTASDGGFQTSSPAYIGTYTPGVGWEDAFDTGWRRIEIYRDFASSTITGASMHWSGVAGSQNDSSGTPDWQYSARITINSAIQAHASAWPTMSPSPIAFSGASLTTTRIILAMIASQDTLGTDKGGSGLITRLTVTGTGTNPFGGTSGGAVVRVSSTNGSSWTTGIDVGTSPGSVGGFDTQRAGANSFAASDGKVRRATTLGGAYSDYYAPTGGAQAACVIVPYYKWGSISTKNTNATHPDIVVGLTAADGSSRTLLWIEGGASPGTVHDITPVASYVFDSPNAITTSYGKYIATAGKVSSTYTLRTCKTLGGAGTWTNVATLTTPHFIRTRRNDGSVTRGKGQLYVTNGNAISYSGYWGGNGIFPRTMPASGVDSLDILG